MACESPFSRDLESSKRRGCLRGQSPTLESAISHTLTSGRHDFDYERYAEHTKVKDKVQCLK